MNELGELLVDPGDRPAVRVLFVQGANPAVMNPAQTQGAGRAGPRADLFTVVHDQVLTDTARLADVVLPATTHFEVDDVPIPYGAFVAEADPGGDRPRRPEPDQRRGHRGSGGPPRLVGATPGRGFDPTVDRIASLALPGGVARTRW